MNDGATIAATLEGGIRLILAFSVALGTLVVIHEGGHFLVAKLFGFPVSIFSVGFGKRLWGFTAKGTDYRISAIPLGGYVLGAWLAHEDEELGGGSGDDLMAAPHESVFDEANPRRLARIAIFSAGPLANLIAALLLLSFAYMLGLDVPSLKDDEVIVGGVAVGSAAERAGMQIGDHITVIGDKEIETWLDFAIEVGVSPGRTRVFQWERGGEPFRQEVLIDSSDEKIGEIGIWAPLQPMRVIRVEPGMPAELAGFQVDDVIHTVDGQAINHERSVASFIRGRAGEEVVFELGRGESRVQVVVTPKMTESPRAPGQDAPEAAKKRALIGISMMPNDMVRVRLPFREALVASWDENVDIARRTFDILGKMFRAEAAVGSTMSGPLGVAQAAERESRGGLSRFLSFMSLVSLQLAIFNLLPIPILDGFHIFLIAIEGVLRRDLSLNVKETILKIGLAFLLVLFAVVMYNDVLKSLVGLRKFFTGS